MPGSDAIDPLQPERVLGVADVLTGDGALFDLVGEEPLWPKQGIPPADVEVALVAWDYLDPATEQIYVNQDDVKVYVPEHKQVLVGKLTQMAASKAPLELLQGAAKLDESFEIVPTTGKDRAVSGTPLITLIPKAKGQESTQNLQKIVVEVFPKTYFIRTVSLYESSGNVAVFEFSNLKPNLGLGNEVFDFKTPSDAEVVRAPVLNVP